MSSSQSKRRWRATVLVALYRAGQFLKAKLETLSKQTAFSECQIVLLNCQNLNGERDLCNSFAARYDNVLVMEYAEYRRLYSTWNDAIAATKSDYVTNSNVDDMLHPKCLAMLIDELDRNSGFDVAHGDSYVSDVPNQLWPDWTWHGRIDTMYPGGTAGPCPMWRRSLHDKFGLFGNYRSIGDARMWEKWHTGGVKFIRVPTVLSLYYHAPGHNLEIRLDDVTGRPLRTMDLDDDAVAQGIELKRVKIIRR